MWEGQAGRSMKMYGKHLSALYTKNFFNNNNNNNNKLIIKNKFKKPSEKMFSNLYCMCDALHITSLQSIQMTFL